MFEDDQAPELADKILERGLLDRAFYLQQRPALHLLSDQELAFDYIHSGETEDVAPSGLFDPAYYRSTNPDLVGVDSLIGHYIHYGAQEQRGGSLATQLILHGLDRLAQTERLIPLVDLDADDPRYATELGLALAACDDTFEYFSNEFYRARHADLAEMAVAPIFHYLKYGLAEGRAVNTELISFDRKLFDPDRPSILVGIHEASKTGAPIVGVDLARSLSRTHNVLLVSLGGGPLLEELRQFVPLVAVAAGYSDAELSHVFAYLKRHFTFDRAIFSSVVCEPMMSRIAALDCHITCLVHEFLEYTEWFRNVAFVSDLLVFSSRELLRSWSTMLNDVSRPPESILVLPQPASASGSRQSPKAEARRKVERATGLDLDGVTLVLGAGQVQMRKGTDIFIQVANQLLTQPERYACIWIGDQISKFELHYGVYLHAQMERSGDGGLAVHFEPAGPLYQVLMDAADVFLVTSRLDPLPNVALDAAARSLPVISFRRATGLSDLAEAGHIDLTEVGYAAVDEMVSALRAKTVRPSKEPLAA